MNDTIDILLARYFGGNASDTDLKLLENWISSSPDNQAEFDRLTTLYEKIGNKNKTLPEPNLIRAKLSFVSHITNSNSKKTQTNNKKKPIPFYKNRILQAACIVIFIVLPAMVWKNYLSDKELTITTNSTNRLEVLPDKTEVVLSKNSKITYSSTGINNSKKNIYLVGEATFTSCNDATTKLQIRAGETIIEDIGTVFQVTAYPQSNTIQVKVSEGEVRFFTLNNNGISLLKNETGIYYTKTKSFKVLAKKIANSTLNSIHLDFQEIYLKDAVSILNNAYNTNIQFADKSLGDKKITVNFDGEDVNTVLQIIAETLNLSISKNANTYRLKNNPLLSE